MKVHILFLLVVAAARCAGQGHVNFSNDPRLFVDDPATGRFVSCIEDGRLTGANWAAQLWYGIGSGLPYDQLTLRADPIAHFFAPGSGVAGTWAGGDRTLPGTTPGINQVLTMGVFVWDTSQSSTWLGAPAHANSIFFSYTVPAADAPADAFVMYGFQGFTFTCVVPEPSTSVLLATGVILTLGCGVGTKWRARRFTEATRLK